MKKLNLIGAFAVAALLFAGCEMSKESLSSFPGETSIVATRDGALTRSVLQATETADGASYEILWSAPDKIYVTYAGVKPAVFKSKNTSKAATATFKGTLPEGEGMLYGIYPAKDNNSVDADGVFSVKFHDEQNAVGGTYDPNAFPAVAVSESNNLDFLNVCGLLELKVGYSNVTKITLVNGYEEELTPLVPNEEHHPLTRNAVVYSMPAGILSVIIEDGEPVIDDFSDSVFSIKLNAPSTGVFNKGEAYYMAVPPCDFPDGAYFILERQSGNDVKVVIDDAVSVERSKVHKVMELVDPNIPDDEQPTVPDEPGTDEPTGPAITIDGDMSDWDDIEGVVNSNVDKDHAIMVVKGFADDDNVYIYIKRAKLGRWEQLWNTEDPGYYYYYFDVDNSASTGDYDNGSEAYTYLYQFGDTAYDFASKPTGGPAGMTINGVISAGYCTEESEAIEIEVAFPRKELPEITASSINVSVKGNKDAKPLTTVAIQVGEGSDEPGDEPGDDPGDDPDEGIKIDGAYGDWAAITGAEPASVFNAFKVTNDAENFYFYVETDPGTRLWSGGGYLYLYFDWDNDLSTGEYSGATGMDGHNYEAYTYMFIFEGNKISAPTSDSVAKGMKLDGLMIAGSDSSDAIVKFEISIPRANFDQKVKAGDVIGINAYRSKDGGNIYFPGYVVL